MASKGFAAPEVEQAYTRARALSQQTNDPAHLGRALCGLRSFYNTRGDYHTARELGEALLTVAQRLQDAGMLVEAYRALGNTLYFQGDLVAAYRYLTQGSTLYDRVQHQALALLYGNDPGVGCRSFAATTLWLLGYPDQAVQQLQAALRLADEIAHLSSRAFALALAAALYQCRGEVQRTREQADALLALAREQGFAFWSAVGLCFRGGAVAAQGQTAEGIAHLRQGLAEAQATGAALNQSRFLGLLAEVYWHAGRTTEGLRTLDDAFTVVNHIGERFHEAELYRLKGELLLVGSTAQHAEAETCLRQALAVARHQQAKSLELRAAMSLSRLWQRQGKRHAARELLAPVYGWFTEGFDTANLLEAKALLEDL